MLGWAFFTASRPLLISRMSLTSSTVPFSQVAMISRCSPAESGTLLALAGFDGAASSVARFIRVGRASSGPLLIR